MEIDVAENHSAIMTLPIARKKFSTEFFLCSNVC